MANATFVVTESCQAFDWHIYIRLWPVSMVKGQDLEYFHCEYLGNGDIYSKH